MDPNDCTYRIDHRARGERGLALLMALMALMILTVLGLTLAATTSTELQVAANYRWSQQAFYNAEAGLEVAKVILQAEDWSGLLPERNGEVWDASTIAAPRAAPTTLGYGGGRNFEMGSCDVRGNGMGYGVVLRGPGGVPLEDQTQYLGRPLNGAFTVWIRRPLVYVTADPDAGSLRDDNENVAMIVVSEGVAPGVQTSGSRAVQVIEATVYSGLPPGCGNREAQAGCGSGGANLCPCMPVDDISTFLTDVGL